MGRTCSACETQRAVLRRPKTHENLCRECFFEALETEVHETICRYGLFKKGEKVALAASGGKDSTVLAHIVTTLNARYECVLALILLFFYLGDEIQSDGLLENMKEPADF